MTAILPLEKTPLERYVAPAKPSLVGLSRAELSEKLALVGVPERARNMRAQQIWHWLYVRGAKQFEAMTSVSKDLRAALDAHFTLDRPDIVAEQISVDGTRKWLLQLPGEHPGEKPHQVECVYIPETDRGTLCVSSQVGCTLNCSFCHTGTQRLVRNLTPGEIVGQIMIARDRLDDFIAAKDVPSDSPRLVSNIVMMGMGEPLYNFEAVRDALHVASDGEGISLSKRRITLSTSGVVPNIARTGAEIGCMLAVSLHAVRDDLARAARAAQPQIPDRGIARCMPQLSRRLQCTAHHVRICDAQGRQRFTVRGEGTGARCSRAFPPRSISFRSIPGRARLMNARTGSRSRNSPRSCSTLAMPRRCAPRAGAISSPPAASSRAKPKNCPRASAWRCAQWR